MKKTLALILAFILVFALCACGAETDVTPTDESTETTAETTTAPTEYIYNDEYYYDDEYYYEEDYFFDDPVEETEFNYDIFEDEELPVE